VSGPAGLRIVFGLGASGLVFWLILRFITQGAALPPSSAFELRWAFAAIFCTTVQMAIIARRWTFFAARLDAPVEYRAALGAYYVSVFLNQVLPFGMLGDAVRGVWHARRSAASAAADRAPATAVDAATALIMDRASGQFVLFALVLPVLPLWWQPVSTAVRGSRHELGLAAALGALLIGALFVAAAWYFRRSLLRHAARGRRIFLRPGALAVHGAYSAAALFMHIAAYACAARALGLSLPFWLALRVVPLVLVASAVPSFAFGTGAREASAAALYHLLGLRAAEGAAIALGLGMLGFVASLPGLFVLATLRFHARRAR
jgi:uncharacterized membrane protein YbhN (UPF0104 family)